MGVLLSGDVPARAKRAHARGLCGVRRPYVGVFPAGKGAEIQMCARDQLHGVARVQDGALWAIRMNTAQRVRRLGVSRVRVKQTAYRIDERRSLSTRVPGLPFRRS